MESPEEYKQACRESDIKSLLRQDNINDLIDRFFNYADKEQVEALKDFLIIVCAENNFIENEELDR